jgi:hypothetical protein
MLKQTADNREAVLTTNNEWVEMGAYPEFIFKGEFERDLEFELFFSTALWDEGKLKQFKLEVALFYDNKTTEIKFKNLECISDDLKIKFKIRAGNIEGADLSYKGKEDFYPRFKAFNFFHYFAWDSALLGYDFKNKYSEFLPYINAIRQISEYFFNFSLHYIGPLRVAPERFYTVKGEKPQQVGKSGEKAIDILWISHLKGIREKELEIKTINWFRKFGFANDIELHDISNRNYYSVIVTDPNTGHKVNLADIGFGASQTIPIIIQSFYAPQNSTILIEQPEIHLHPRAQLTLGDLFVSAVNESPRTFIIETHSEHLLSRVCRNIAEKKIKKEDVAIYYFNPTGEGTKIQRVTLNDNGQYEDFPKGFFEEDIDEAFEHLKAIKNTNNSK